MWYLLVDIRLLFMYLVTQAGKLEHFKFYQHNYVLMVSEVSHKKKRDEITCE